MAKLMRGLPQEFIGKKILENDSGVVMGFLQWDSDSVYDEWDMDDQAFNKLCERALHVWKFPMADSNAYYEVLRLEPLQLQWIPFGDQHEAPAYAIRGLEKEDIIEDMKWEKTWNKAIAKSLEDLVKGDN